MNIDVYFRRFILIFTLGKLLLVILAYTLGGLNAYASHQVKDIIYIIVPTLVASFAITLKYLRSVRYKEALVEITYKVYRTEIIIVFSALVFYLLFVVLQLLALQASPEAFIDMKSKIAWAEAFAGGLFGWVILDINNNTK